MIDHPRLLALGFVSPLWLWALGGVAIPLAIHLWRRQTPRIERWAAMQFLRSALEHNSRRLRLESLLLLLVRCGLLALLALALSEPFQESVSAIAPGARRTHKVLVIDGSMSMSARQGTESRFEQACQKAREIVEQSAVGDSFNLCRIGSASPSIIIRRPAHDSADVLREIDRLPLLDDWGDISGTLRQVGELVAEIPPDQSAEVYILSDYQSTNWSGETPAQDAQLRQTFQDLASRAQLYLVGVGGNSLTNVALQTLQVPDLVAFTGRSFRVDVGVASYSDQEETRTIEVLADHVVRSTQTVTLPPWGEQRITLNLKIPEASSSVVLEARIGEDAIATDNQIRRVVAVRQSLDVLLVDGRPSETLEESAAGFVRLAISPGSGGGANSTAPGSLLQPTECTVAGLSQVDLGRYDCVVLCDVAGLGEAEVSRLTAFANAGGGLVVGLGDQTEREEFQRTLGAGLCPVEVLEFADHVDEPVHFETRDLDHVVLAPFRGRTDSGLSTAPISRFARMKPRPEGNWQVVLPFTTGEPAILERPQGRGRVVLVTTSLDDSWGHWVLWPSYVPLVNRLLQYSLEGRLRSDPVTVGTPLRETYPEPVEGTVLLPTDKSVAALVETTGPETALFWPDTGLAGTYQIAAGPPVNRQKTFAVNPDVRESDPRVLTVETLRRSLLAGTAFEWVTDMRAIARDEEAQVTGQTTYARPLIGGVIALLLVELLLAWRFRWGALALASVVCGALLLWVTT
ncbi:MAG: VWA domain-containing protein [Planctomycetota bacterium]|nr:MAG: VWA domain-containing protein [Planctomycetota bacterium]